MVDVNKGVTVLLRFLRSRILASAILVIACTATVFATASASYTVRVHDGSQVYTIDTIATEAEDVLKNADISIGEFDIVDYTGFIAGEDSEITIQRAFLATVEADSNISYVILYGGTVADALAKAGIILQPDDKVVPSADTPLTNNLTIIVTRAFQIRVEYDGKVATPTLINGNVADALAALQISVGEFDQVEPALDDPLQGGMTISLDRIEYTELSQTITVGYDILEEKSATLFVGESQKIQDGVDGEKLLSFKNKLFNGELVESLLLSEVVTKEPVPEKWLIGTKPNPTTTTTTIPTTTPSTTKPKPTEKPTLKPTEKTTDPFDDIDPTKPSKKNGKSPAIGNPPVKGGCDGDPPKIRGKISILTEPDWLELDARGLPYDYETFIDGLATAYYAKPGAKTATGKTVRQGYIAVNPKQIPYGSRLYILSHDGNFVYGYSIAVDTGGFAKKNRITVDLFFDTYDQCAEFGVRSVRIYVLKSGY